MEPRGEAYTVHVRRARIEKDQIRLMAEESRQRIGPRQRLKRPESVACQRRHERGAAREIVFDHQHERLHPHGGAQQGTPT